MMRILLLLLVLASCGAPESDAPQPDPRIGVLAADLREMNGALKTDPLGRLVEVDLNDRTNQHFKDYHLNQRVNDAWLQRLGFRDLRKLDVANADIRGPGLRQVGTLTALERLNLTLTPIQDDALEPLSGLVRLRVLGLASTKVTGTCARYLTKLEAPENLNFHLTPVNDLGLEQIGKVASLKRPEIVHTMFTDASARHLANLVQFEETFISRGSGPTVAGSTRFPLGEVRIAMDTPQAPSQSDEEISTQVRSTRQNQSSS